MPVEMLKRQSGFTYSVLAVLLAVVAYFAVKAIWPKPAVINAGPPTVKLISQSQYENTIQYIFGQEINVPAQFPPVFRVDGLTALGATQTDLTPSVVERFYSYGKLIAEQVMATDKRRYLVPCQPRNMNSADEPCAREFISRTGELLFRRPLTDTKLDRLSHLASEAADTVGDFYQGLGYVLTVMLASPEFVMISDHVEADPDHPGEYRLDAYSRASRMSFFLWNSAPDQALLAAAAKGDLYSEQGLAEQLERMIESSRLEDSLRGFFADMLEFEEFENLAKDSVIYPSFRPRVAGEAAEQMLRMITHHLIDQQGDYRDLFTTRKTFMTNALGAIYQVSVNPAEAFVPYEFPDNSPRAGLLTHVGFLSLHSHPGRSSPTRRGMGLREEILCQPVPLPPPNVDFTNFEDAAGDFKTARDRLVRHSSDPACANCHKITDPTGLGLEQFDGAGQFRLTENQVEIDASGELDGFAFTDASSLGEAVKNNPATTSCILDKMLAYAINRPLVYSDQPITSTLHDEFAADGYRIPDLMKSIVLSPAFFAVKFSPQTVAQLNDAVTSIH